MFSQPNLIMNKPTQNFKLSKTAKRMMATIVDAHARGHFKRMMIDAQLEAEKRPVSKKGESNE